MADITLEKVLELLEKQNKRIQRLEDVNEITNMMGRYIYKHEVHQDAEFLNTIFAKRDDITWEVANFGKFLGQKGVKRTLDAHSGIFAADEARQTPFEITNEGGMIMHTLTTPVIEVAEDGQTAKGVWISPGHETMFDAELGRLRGHWCWTKYGCDFVKEDGKWKLWHYHVYRIFRTPYDMDWALEYEPKQEAANKGMIGMGMQPDLPPTYDNPYTVKYVAQYVPAPPEPFKTFDPESAY